MRAAVAALERCAGARIAARLMAAVLLAPAAILIAVAPLRADEPAATMLVVDGSDAMLLPVSAGAPPRLTVARDAVRRSLARIDKGTRVGVAVFGRREQVCIGVDVLREAEPLDVARIEQALGDVAPKGRGSLTLAVMTAARALGATGRRSLVVLQGDNASCDVGLCIAAADLKAAGITAHVVGLGLAPKDAGRIACLSGLTGGRFINAQTPGEVAIAVEDVMRLASLPGPSEARPATPPPAAPAAESAARDEKQRAAEEEARKAAEAKKAADEAARRMAEAIKAADAKKAAEEAHAAEAKKAAEEEARRIAEAKKAAEEEVRRAAEAKRAADEEARRIAEAKKAAEEESARIIAAARKAAEEESHRIAAAKKAADEEARRVAEARKAAEEEAQRIAAARKATEEEAQRVAAARKATEEEALRVVAARKAAEEEGRRIAAAKKAAEQESARIIAAARKAAEEETRRAAEAKKAADEEAARAAEAKKAAEAGKRLAEAKTADGEGRRLAEARRTDERSASAGARKNEPAPSASAGPQPTPEQNEQAARLIAQGDRYLAQGNVLIARQYYRRASDLRVAAGALKLAATYDPRELARLRVRGVAADPKEAKRWYTRASELGSVEAGRILAEMDKPSAGQ